MVAGKFKSRTFRRVYVRTPSGKTALHYRSRKVSAAVCAETGQKIIGVKTGKKYQIRGMSKSQRRPSRAYGGVLSSSAARAKIVAKARAL